MAALPPKCLKRGRPFFRGTAFVVAMPSYAGGLREHGRKGR